MNRALDRIEVINSAEGKVHICLILNVYVCFCVRERRQEKHSLGKKRGFDVQIPLSSKQCQIIAVNRDVYKYHFPY